MTRLLRSPLLAILLSVVGCVQIYQGGGGPAAAPSAGAAAKGDEAEKSRFKPWDEVLEDAEEVEGFLTFHRKRGDTLYLEVDPDRLGEDFGLVMHYSRGVGDFNVQEGLPLSDTRLMRVRRAGDRIELVHVNPRFTAGGDEAYETGLATNVGHSVVASWEIVSERKESGHLLVDVGKFFVSDYPEVGERLKSWWGGKPVSLDGGRSRVGRLLGFPRNVELDAELTFTTSDPPALSGGYGVSDPRSIPVGVRYSLFALPEEPMTPRLADDRVGYILDARWDFSRDQTEVPYVRYIDRWRLEKRDPDAEVSEPVEPIVYYVDPSVPAPYRRWVKEGIEAWNKAFAAAGFRGAIVAKDPPADDSTWSAEDIRYSTVRWTPSYNMSYAIGPSQSDPRTGEILNADILLSSSFLRYWTLEYQDMVGDGTAAAGPAAEERTTGYGTGGGLEALFERHDAARRLAASVPEPLRDRLCMAQAGRAHQMALGRTLLAALGGVPERPPEEYVGAAIRDLVMHEVGHTLGLRHNYKASSAIPHGKLNDESFTGDHGLTLSVMDYAPVNVSPDRAAQGHYWNTAVGSYDVWAIRYGYSVIPEQPEDGPLVTTGPPAADARAELAGLRKIAETASDPMHAYNTDEDVYLGAYAVDPLSNAWDLGSDPLAFARDRADLVRRVLPRLEERLIAEGEGYQRLRGATTSLIFERWSSLAPLTKMIGGLYFHRDHKGDPRGRLPFEPVPAGRQREALRLIVDEAFAEDAFDLDPELLAKLPPNRYRHWGVPFATLPVDYPLHSYVLLVQRDLIQELLAPPRLWRMIDGEARAGRGADRLRPAELFGTLTRAVWSEIGLDGGGPRPATSIRRNLQRIHLEHLGDLLLDRPTGFPTASVPEDARSLARAELAGVARRIGEVLDGGAGLDPMTRAHLEESAARIGRLLETSLQIPVR